MEHYRHLTFVAGALLMALLAAPPAISQEPRIRVHVFTAPALGGFTDEQSKRRATAVAEANDWMGRKYKSVVELVEREEADVIVEVLDAPDDQSATQTLSWWAGVARTRRVKGDVQVIARLRVGDYSTEIFTQHKKIAIAGRIVGQEIAKWAKENRAQILQHRERAIGKEPVSDPR